MVDSTYLIEVFRPNQRKKLPNAQKNREVATVAEIVGDGAPVQSVNGKTGAVVLAAADVGALPDTYTPPAQAWVDITGKPAVIAAGADQATARSAIGAGTSSLALGTTAGTALAGNTAIPAASATAPAALAPVAAVGVGTTFARADHVHAIPGPSVGTTRGTVLIQPAIADLVAAPTEANFNALLAALRAAGVLAA